jgi:signal transduction histidine kinase
LNGAPQPAKKRAGRKGAPHIPPAHERGVHAVARTNAAVPGSDLTLPCVAHDLNNVFQVLLAAADVLAGDPQWQGVSAAILRSVERGQEIAASLVSAGQPPAELDVLVRNAMALAKDSMIAGRGPQIHFVSDVEPGLVLPRAWAWERVLINLLLNAVHAMPDGGTATVRARRVNDRIEIVVSDEGTGIAPELLPAIFKPHVTTRAVNGSATGPAAGPGRGLGLHIVHTIVTEQRGEVRVANRPEGGAEFIIQVPDSTAQAERLARSAGA